MSLFPKLFSPGFISARDFLTPVCLFLALLTDHTVPVEQNAVKREKKEARFLPLSALEGVLPVLQTRYDILRKKDLSSALAGQYWGGLS